MQREIKFRVWLKDSKEWGSPACLEVFNSSGKLEYLYNNPCIIQQYTGLKDKNGKDIYEGDIVKLERNISHFGEERYETMILPVKYFPEFGFKAAWGHKDCNKESLLKCEIIGNIFQPPCNPDHNGECLNCDNWISECEFRK